MMKRHEQTKSRIIRTLLVNDSPKMLKALSQILAREDGFAVVGSATDGCQALRHVHALMPELVLMGLHLTKLSAEQVTGHIKHSMSPPVVFIVNSDDNPNSRAISEAAGADAIIASSPDLEVGLRSRLREWFSPKTSCTPKRRKAPRALPRGVFLRAAARLRRPRGTGRANVSLIASGLIA